MSDELDIEGVPAVTPEKTAIPFAPLGDPIAPGDVRERLSNNLYIQLSENDDGTTEKAVSRAEIYVGAILRRLGVPYDLDNQIVREVVLINTVYELHIALGHEEAGREYRLKAKDIILAAWGPYPDSDNASSGTPVVAAVANPKRRNF
jgi:hypothetical protein